MPRFVINHFRRKGQGWKTDRTVLPANYQSIAEALRYAKEDANLVLRYDYRHTDQVSYDAATQGYALTNAKGKVLERWQITKED